MATLWRIRMAAPAHSRVRCGIGAVTHAAVVDASLVRAAVAPCSSQRWFAGSRTTAAASPSRLADPRGWWTGIGSRMADRAVQVSAGVPTVHVRWVLSAGLLGRLTAAEAHHEQLSKELMDSNTPPNKVAKLSREVGRLSGLVEASKRHRELTTSVDDCQTLMKEAHASGDKEMASLAAEELAESKAELEEVEKDIKRRLIPADPADDLNVIVEVRAGTGGEEAGLFCAEVFRMYERLANSQGWQFSVLSTAPMGADGLREATAQVAGEGVFRVLKYERGVHRVQRVPLTEAQGRVHTSTITVAILPEPEEVDIQINPSDLRIDTFRSSGNGGQSVNTTDSAVRITHIPTGTVVSMQDERSQHANRDRAMKVLRARIFEQMREKAEAERVSARRAQVGTGDRSERIRTYNFAQDRITDHRVKISKFGMSSMMEGGYIEEFSDAMREAEELELMEALETESAEAATSK